MTLRGAAQEPIAFGALVLCRGNRVWLAGPELANGTARARPIWSDAAREYAAGEFLFVDPVAGLGERDLHAIANGPIMDANALFLPAGKLSEADYRRRVAADLSVLDGGQS